MMRRKSLGYVLFEVVIATVIIVIILSFINATLISTVKDNNKLRTVKEIRESALGLEEIIKINVKKTNSLSQLIFNDIIIKDFKIDNEYEADAISFDRTEKNTTENFMSKRFVISKYMGIGNNKRSSLWCMNVSADKDFSYDVYRYASKYEVGTYIKNIYITKLDDKTYVIRLGLELNKIFESHSFIVKTV
ncbi:MAG: hypothetical protein ACRDA4_06360 [Filifactoraceae bacterium]